MSHTKRTVNERLSSALLIADENNRRLAVRMAKLEAAITAICEATGIELEFENPEIEEAAKAILGLEIKADSAAGYKAVPEGADPEGHWHASCVHGFEWGNQCRCIPKEIEYKNAPCPKWCDGKEHRITRHPEQVATCSGFETVARMVKPMPTLTIDRSEPGLDVLTGPRLLQPRIAGKYPEGCEIAALDALAKVAAQVEP